MSNYVLIVDDNTSDQKLAKLLVEGEGFVSVVASDAHAAIDKLSDYDFKLFIVDIQMPQVSGLELLRRFKRMDAVKNIPVLIMSGRNTAEDVKKAVALGASDYVIKPIDPAVFTEKISQILKDKKSAWSEYIVGEENRPGVIHEYCDILSVNEIGMTVKYNRPIAIKDSKYLDGKIFKEIGISSCLARCYESTPIEEGFYIAKMSFVGMTEEDRKKLRLYCRKLWSEQHSHSA